MTNSGESGGGGQLSAASLRALWSSKACPHLLRLGCLVTAKNDHEFPSKMMDCLYFSFFTSRMNGSYDHASFLFSHQALVLADFFSLLVVYLLIYGDHGGC